MQKEPSLFCLQINIKLYSQLYRPNFQFFNRHPVCKKIEMQAKIRMCFFWMFLLIFSVPFSGFYSDLFKFRPRECKLYRAKNCTIVSSSLWFRTGKGTFGVEKERKKDECITVLIFVLFPYQTFTKFILNKKWPLKTHKRNNVDPFFLKFQVSQVMIKKRKNVCAAISSRYDIGSWLCCTVRLIQGTFNTVWVWYSRNVRCHVLSGAVPGRPNSEPQAFLQVRSCARAGNLSRRRRRRRSTIWQKLLVKRVWNAASCSRPI